jgi:hypothetical protein
MVPGAGIVRPASAMQPDRCINRALATRGGVSLFLARHGLALLPYRNLPLGHNAHSTHFQALIAAPETESLRRAVAPASGCDEREALRPRCAAEA